MELGTVNPEANFSPHDDLNSPSSHASVDGTYYQRYDCLVDIEDDEQSHSDSAAFEASSMRTNITMPDQLKSRLVDRKLTSSRWISIVGYSGSLIDVIAKHHLEGHPCLYLGDASKQTLGGPITLGDQGQFIWLQTQIWFIGSRTPQWSSLRRGTFRMVVCLPTATQAGTLITSFLGPTRLAQELRDICRDRVLESHPLGRKSLGCVWTLAFALLRTIAEQLDFTFALYDPITPSPHVPTIPGLDDLPMILEKSNRLAMIDRYLSTLDEHTSFFRSVHRLLPLEEATKSSVQTAAFLSKSTMQATQLEVERTREKIVYGQRLCNTYIRQYDTLIQMVISYNTTHITQRLDAGRNIAEQFTKIGIFLAALASVVAPISLLTGYYGMNVQQFSSGGMVTLYDFWKIGVPLLLGATVFIAIIALRTLTHSNHATHRSRTASHF